MAITINAVTRRKQYTSSGSLGPYSFNFKILAATDVAVYVGSTLKTVTTHYTTIYNADGTGSVTFTSGNAPAADTIVTLESNQAIERTSDYTTGGDLKAASLNDDLDRLAINDQQLQTNLTLNVQLPSTVNRDTSAAGIGPLFFPYDDTVLDQANKSIVFDAAGTALAAGPTASEITSAGTSATAAATSATASASSASTASTQATNSSNSATASASSATSSGNSATASATSATAAAASAALIAAGTASTTSLAIGTGSKAFTIAAGLGFNAGDYVLATSDADITNYMHGQIASYSSTTLTVTVTLIGGSGTKTDWTIRLSGIGGATGSTGSTGSTGATGAQGPSGDLTDVVGDSTPQLGGDLDCNGSQIQWSKGADVASGTALPVLTDGNYFDVTGTTTVTSINTTGGAGTLIKLHFDGAVTLTHHATNLILAGAANYTTGAGDEIEFVEYDTGKYRMTGWSLAGTAPGGGGGGAFLGEGASGASVGNSGDIIRVNQQTLDTNQTMAATDNGSATGPLTIASGVTLTIASGGTFVII